MTDVDREIQHAAEVGARVARGLRLQQNAHHLEVARAHRVHQVVGDVAGVLEKQEPDDVDVPGGDRRGQRVVFGPGPVFHQQSHHLRVAVGRRQDESAPPVVGIGPRRAARPVEEQARKARGPAPGRVGERVVRVSTRRMVSLAQEQARHFQVAVEGRVHQRGVVVAVRVRRVGASVEEDAGRDAVASRGRVDQRPLPVDGVGPRGVLGPAQEQPHHVRATLERGAGQHDAVFAVRAGGVGRPAQEQAHHPAVALLDRPHQNEAGVRAGGVRRPAEKQARHLAIASLDGPLERAAVVIVRARRVIRPVQEQARHVVITSRRRAPQRPAVFGVCAGGMRRPAEKQARYVAVVGERQPTTVVVVSQRRAVHAQQRPRQDRFVADDRVLKHRLFRGVARLSGHPVENQLYHGCVAHQHPRAQICPDHEPRVAFQQELRDGRLPPDDGRGQLFRCDPGVVVRIEKRPDDVRVMSLDGPVEFGFPVPVGVHHRRREHAVVAVGIVPRLADIRAPVRELVSRRQQPGAGQAQYAPQDLGGQAVRSANGHSQVPQRFVIKKHIL